jgi:hypothetical protein
LAVALALLASAPRSGAQLGKGHQILINRGLQVQGLVTKDDVFHLNTYSNAHYTAIHWLWNSHPPQHGAAPGFPWARWAADEANVPPQGAEADYLSQLVMLQLADEWHLNDSAIRDRAVNWFNAIRANWPNTILYMNSWGGQVNDANLGDFITRAQPDMLCFDTYPWRSDYTTREPLSGPPTSWYSELRRYREHARGAHVPFGGYVQTFQAVQDYDQTVYRNPSPSELRLNHFGALAFNAKVLIDFTYNTGASSLFTPPGGDSNPSALYAEKADCALRARNLGKALVRLGPIADTNAAYTTSILFIRGKDAGGTPNPIPIGFVPDDALPNSITDWVADRNDPWLRGWVVTNKGTKNNGQIGDVLIAWFKLLDERFDGPDYTNQIYFMVVNGLTDPTGTAADCAQEIKLNFVNAFASAVFLDPVTGRLQTNAVPPISGTRRQLVLNLNGGDAALFKLANAAPFAGWPTRPQLGLHREGAQSAVTVQGAMAARYQIEATGAVIGDSWSVLTNLLLPETLFVFHDLAASNINRRFYRAQGIP